MNHIEKQGLKEIRSLDAASFFHLLVTEGCRLSLISPGQLEALQYQIIELLTEQLNRWTGGQSSSVPVETGQQIQQSVFYTAGYYLKSLPDPECALEALKGNPLKDIFLQGKQLIEINLKEAKELLRSIQGAPLATDVFAYNDTLANGLPMFFTSYDMDYEAHETPASIDYPLSSDNMNQTGIEYIHGYLQKLHLENEFCQSFSNEEIHCLLRGYDRQYKELLFNIYELVLVNAVGSQLLGRNEIDLNISCYDRQYLRQSLIPLSALELDQLTDEAVSRLCCKLSNTNALMEKHIKASSARLKSRLKNALETDSLEKLFLSADEDAEEPLLKFEDKTRLDHDSFRRLADDIRDCRFISDKIILLHRSPLGITDLVDLLEGSCFFDDEFYEVFKSLEEIQLALLMKKIPFEPDSSGIFDEESSRDWHRSFHMYLMQMDPMRKSAVDAIADRIALS